MNNIIALTDFSPAAENATIYAAHLTRALGSELILLHVYQLPVAMNDMPVLMVSAEELRNNSDAGLHRAKELVQREVPELTIRTESRLGDVNDEVDGLSKELPTFAVVVGTHSYRGIEKMLFGNTALSVVKHCHYPVIVVPDTYQGSGIRRIVFATDFREVHPDVLEKINSFVHTLGAELHIVHVATEEEEQNMQPVINSLASLQPVYRVVQNNSVTNGLRHYIHEAGADLLIALPHKHNLLDGFLFKLHTGDLVEHIDTPLLFIHD